LGTYAAYGVTTVVSLGGESVEVIGGRRSRVPASPRARHLVAGSVVSGATAAAAAAEVASNAGLGVDIVKIRVDDNLGTTQKMPEAAWRAAIDEAHRRGLRVAAHVYYLEDARRLLEAGVDFIAHSVRDREVDESFIDLLRSRDVCTSPTLMREVSTFVYETTPDFFSDPVFLAHANREWIASLREPARQASTRTSQSAQSYKASLVTAKRNLSKVARAGATIAMGTDTGPMGRFQGYFELMELELMVEAGLTPSQALRAATNDAARCLKLERELGTLEPGKWADFVVLDADPTLDIGAVRRISSVWIGGERVAR
ncbi:MAG: amidohydrolase family protein, partial [Gemmatimonadota bacterium]